MIGIAANKLTELDVLVLVLQNFGKRHGGYGVQDSHYKTVGAALLKTLGRELGQNVTAEVKAAWVNVYGVMAEVRNLCGK